MKMLFFSSERSEVEQVRKECVEAGIPCEVRDPAAAAGSSPNSSDTELWIRNDTDSHRARMLCVHLRVGFGKRRLAKGQMAKPEDEAPEEAEFPEDNRPETLDRQGERP
jgi:hypothetical protein